MEEAQTLLAAAAGTVPARARFIARFIGTTTFSSVTVGAVLGQCGAMLPCGMHSSIESKDLSMISTRMTITLTTSLIF